MNNTSLSQIDVTHADHEAEMHAALAEVNSIEQSQPIPADENAPGPQIETDGNFYELSGKEEERFYRMAESATELDQRLKAWLNEADSIAREGYKQRSLLSDAQSNLAKAEAEYRESHDSKVIEKIVALKTEISARQDVIDTLVTPGLKERKDKHIPEIQELYDEVLAFEKSEHGMRSRFAQSRNRKINNLFSPTGDFCDFLPLLGIWLTANGYTVVENPEALEKHRGVKTRLIPEPNGWLRKNGFGCEPDDFDSIELKHGAAIKEQYRRHERDLMRLSIIDPATAGMPVAHHSDEALEAV